MKYTIGLDSWDEGGSAEFYNIKENRNLGFKQFRNKRFANIAYQKQKLLSKFGLAPKVYGKVCKLSISSIYWNGVSGWGFITEKAKVFSDHKMSKKLPEIQFLVENIEKKTKLKFWDCHYSNVGYVKRNNKVKLVCLDTGTESFDRNCNAWGFENPGPKCSSCKRYQCKCSDGFWFD